VTGILRRIFGQPASRRGDAEVVTRGARLLRARYDAAVTTDDNRRHWGNADSLSANAANSPAIRCILRNRSRYEVANNSYARGIILTLANDVIGTGPRLQMLSDSAEANRQIEQEFSRWSTAVRLAQKLRTMRTAQAQDGETFGILATNPRLTTPVKLDLRLVEADQVTTPDLTLPQPTAVDGIAFDRFGNPVEYHVLRRHPGDQTGLLGLDYDRVPADAVIHLFRADRPGQARGIPEIMPALPLFAQLRRYTLAVTDAAETAARIAAFLKTTSNAIDPAEVEAWAAIEMERNALLTLPDGWDISQIKAEHPSTTYAEFKKEILNEIARCLNMPFNIAAGNSASYNYASGRLDHQMYFRSIRVDQDHIECVALDRVLAAWLDEAILVEGYLPQALRTLDARFPHQWFWDGPEHVDPEKEANAQTTRLSAYTTTLADEYARRGQDWETQLRQRAKELELMRELGLTPDQAQPASATPANDSTDPEEPADAEQEPVAAD
jgi:lambda family phage portal protein